MCTLLHTKTLCVDEMKICLLSSLRPRDYLCATGSFSGEVNMNANVDSEEENSKLAMGTAAATVGHRAHID